MDGESIAFAVGRLLQRKEKRKVLLVLCDGVPSGECGDKPEMLEAHLHQTIAKARAAGVEVYCIGVQTYWPARYYAKNPTAVMKRMEEMEKLARSAVTIEDKKRVVEQAKLTNDPYFSWVSDINDLPPSLMRQLEAVLFNK